MVGGLSIIDAECGTKLRTYCEAIKRKHLLNSVTPDRRFESCLSPRSKKEGYYEDYEKF